MMILKTKLGKLPGLLLGLAVSASPARALDRVACLRDLLPATERGRGQIKRAGLGEPFLANTLDIVIPARQGRQVTGFYLYRGTRAWFYDHAVNARAVRTRIRDLRFVASDGIYDLVAHPEGVETVSIPFLPEFDPMEKEAAGPVMLGSSILPVIGAFVSRPDREDTAYINPRTLVPDDLQAWARRHGGGRSPAAAQSTATAAASTEPLPTTILRLEATEMPTADLWRPLENELRARRAWVQTHNLDQQSFVVLTRAMAGACRDLRNGEIGPAIFKKEK